MRLMDEPRNDLPFDLEQTAVARTRGLAERRAVVEKQGPCRSDQALASQGKASENVSARPLDNHHQGGWDDFGGHRATCRCPDARVRHGEPVHRVLVLRWVKALPPIDKSQRPNAPPDQVRIENRWSVPLARVFVRGKGTAVSIAIGVPRMRTTAADVGIVRLVTILLVLTALVAGASFARAAEGQAWLGEPFGVGHLVLPLPAGSSSTVQTRGVPIQEKAGRIFYPAFRTSGGGELLSGLLGVRVTLTGGQLDIWFLFRGQGPLELTLATLGPEQMVIVPEATDAPTHLNALRMWQRQFVASLREAADSDPALQSLEGYLSSMLATRLHLPTPTPTAMTAAADELPWQHTLDLLLGRSRLRQRVLLTRLQGGATPEQSATLPLPANLRWPRPAVNAERLPETRPSDGLGDKPPAEKPAGEKPPAAKPPAAKPPAVADATAGELRPGAAAAAEVPIEPLARHVPAECFYLRFGNFPNYLWFSDLSEEHGGNLAQMVTLEARVANLPKRVETQIALKKSSLAEVLGPHVISDVALIGRDLYLEDGAAVGMLFEASNSLLLTADIQQQRLAALEAERENGATLEKISIAGQTVSFLSTPDNRLRSFYAVDGAYHLVCTSRAMVERFFAAGAGEQSLANSPTFQQLRRERPIRVPDTLLAYLSPEFFEQLCSPQYQIEARRRLDAVVDLELAELARLAARGEGQPSESLEQLIAGGFLPEGFGRRADGSGPIFTATGSLDSLRGGRGYLTPIPDVMIEGVTAIEAQRYAELTAFQQQSWTSMDPVMIAVRRQANAEGGPERLEIDAQVAPLVEEKYGDWLTSLGPATNARIAMAADHLVSLQLSLRGGKVAPDLPPHQLFVGLEDTAIRFQGEPRNLLQSIQLLRSLPGYLGSWPALGILDWLPLRGPRRELGNGFSRLPLGVYRWQGRDFSLLSFDPAVLTRAADVVRPEASDRAAQARVHVGDLTQAQLGGWVSRFEHSRAYRASLANVRFMHALVNQFHVPPATALQTAENLLHARVVCTLGGEYVYDASEERLGSWRSTAWDAEQVPEAYRAPVLDWFRGLDAELIKQDSQLNLHAVLLMQRDQPSATPGRTWLDRFTFPRPTP